MAKPLSARADAPVSTPVSSAQVESSHIERCPSTLLLPTVFKCELEKALYFTALSDTRTVLKNLAELRATRVSKSWVDFIRKHEAFAPLLVRLTKNYWLTLTDEEKRTRSTMRHQTVALKRAQALFDGTSIRKKTAKKFFKAHQLNKPIRLSTVELAWLDSHADCRAVVSVKSNFLIPTSREAFDFSDEAYTQLAARLRFEMLTPNDVSLLNAHGVPILPDNTLSLDDASWAREPYTKAVLYRLVKYRKDEQVAQAERMKAASTHIEKPFKRIHLSDEMMLSEPIAIGVNPAPSHESTAQPPSTQTQQPLKRIELEQDEIPSLIINNDKATRHLWIEETKEKVRSLFRIATTCTPLLNRCVVLLSTR